MGTGKNSITGGNKTMKQYKITKLFITGILKGLMYTEITSVNFELNKTYNNYKIICKQEVIA